MLQPAPVQSTYNRYQPVGQNGDLASEINFTADTRTVETAGGIGFGLAVSQGTLSDAGCIIGGTAFVGVTRADKTLARAEGLPVDVYPQYDNAGILCSGDLFVNCYASVHPGDAVTYDTTTGKLGAAGTTIEDARWQTTAAGSANAPVVAVVRIGNIAGNR
jgi:hypothetical protein